MNFIACDKLNETFNKHRKYHNIFYFVVKVEILKVSYK